MTTMEHVRHFIGGKLVPGDAWLPRQSAGDPLTGYEVALGDHLTVQRAVDAAHRALPAWSGTPVRERAALLKRCADWLVERYGEPNELTELKRRITTVVGKPAPEADVEVIETSDFIRFFCDVAEEALADETLSLDQNLWSTKRSVVIRQPIGVVAVIKPWNYPLEMIAWSLFPALLAGNTVVVKPSEKSAAVAMAFAEMASDLALPPGILNIIHGDGSTGSLLVQNDTVRFVSFTGSVRAGRQIAAECARRLIRCSLELGGNDAAIVLPDADLDLTANGLVWGAFCNGGQVCVGIKRAYVDQSIYPQLLEAISSRIRDLRPFVDVGPMVDEQQRDTVVEFVADAVSRGAQAITGVSDDGPLYFPPVVLTNVDPSSRLLSDECFGPVLPLVQVKSTEEAVALANKSNYGLGASIWTSNHDAARVLAGKLEVGMVWVNDVNVAFPQAVWGGLKNSGSSFELGAEAIRNYTTPKHYCDETSSDVRRAWWYPY